jgi:phosphatidylglycerophosphate synthase
MQNAGDNQPERRPIAARRWRLSQFLAQRLARAGVSANAISLIGMISGIAAGAALAATSYLSASERVWWLAAAILIELRLLANMLDGMVALQCGTASPLGEIYNEVPDRVSDTATLIGAGYALGGNVALGFLAACTALFTAYVRAIGKPTGAAGLFCGPMAKPHRMQLLAAVALYCGLAPESWRPHWVTDPVWGLMAIGLLVIVIGSLLTAGRRLARIAEHLGKPRP